MSLQAPTVLWRVALCLPEARQRSTAVPGPEPRSHALADLAGSPETTLDLVVGTHIQGNVRSDIVGILAPGGPSICVFLVLVNWWSLMVSAPQLRLMGVFRASMPDRVLMFPPTGQRVLAYLALNEAAARSELAGALWPDHPQQRALSDLRTALWRLQRVCDHFVDSQGAALSLKPDVEVDIWALTAWATEAISPSASSVLERPQLPASLGRTMLPGWDENWLDVPRTRLHMLRVQALESVATRLLTAGRVAEAVPFVLSVLETDPLRESAQQLMLEIHLRQGNISDALRQFDHYRTQLRHELGIEPGLRVTTLIGQYAARPSVNDARRA